MQGKYFQSPQGNITILVMEHSILIWDVWGGNHWMVANPDSPRAHNVNTTGTIDFDERSSGDEILELINSAIAEKQMQQP